MGGIAWRSLGIHAVGISGQGNHFGDPSPASVEIGEQGGEVFAGRTVIEIEGQQDRLKWAEMLWDERMTNRTRLIPEDGVLCRLFNQDSQQFEEEQPNTFLRMYQFWCQKI